MWGLTYKRGYRKNLDIFGVIKGRLIFIFAIEDRFAREFKQPKLEIMNGYWGLNSIYLFCWLMRCLHSALLLNLEDNRRQSRAEREAKGDNICDRRIWSRRLRLACWTACRNNDQAKNSIRCYENVPRMDVIKSKTTQGYLDVNSSMLQSKVISNQLYKKVGTIDVTTLNRHSFR